MRECIAALILCLCANPAYALQWKDLHELADSLSPEEARANAEKRPGSIENLYVLGLASLNLHKDDDAEEAFNKIIALAPFCHEAQWGLSEVLRRRHRADQSEAMINEILESNPDFSPALITLAYIKYNQLDFENSVRLASKVVRQGRNNVDLSNYTRSLLIIAGAKGMLAHFGGPVSKVINGAGVFSTLKEAELLQPNSPGVLFGIGCFYLLAPPLIGGDKNKALEYLQRAVKADPLFADACVRLAQAYRLKGDKEKYELYLQKAREIDPQNELVLDIRSGRCGFICVGGKE
jgi:tetratricopeptide (TPR) repeat protein